jgi:hypothetical protein
VLSLLLVNIALCVAKLHECVSAESSRQVLLPEQHHRVLLQQLGVEWLQQLPFAESIRELRMRQPMQLFVAVSQSLIHHLNRAAEGTGSSSSSSSTSATATAATAAIHSSGSGCSSATVADAAMLTLLQAALLPMPGKELSSLAEWSGLLNIFLMQLSGSAAAAAAAVMLQPMLTQLMPAGLTVITSATRAVASNSDTARPHSASAEEHESTDAAAATGTGMPLEMGAELFCGTTAASLRLLLSTGGQQ